MVNRRILVVDDEAGVTLALEGFFRNKGYQVLRAFYGDQALEQIGRHRPSVVILDLQMPQLNGIAVLEQIRKRYPEIKTLVITGHLDLYQEDLDRLKPEVVKLKPFSLEELTRAVESLLGETTAPSPPKTQEKPARVRLLFVEVSEEITEQYLKPYFEEPQRQGQYELMFASGTEEAFRLLEEFKPHLLFLDSARLPVGMDAGRLAADLQTAANPPLEVVLHPIHAPLRPSEEFAADQLKQLEESIQRLAQQHHLL